MKDEEVRADISRMQGQEVLTMTRGPGVTKYIHYKGISGKDVLGWIPGGAGTYAFRLKDGLCLWTPGWKLTPASLAFARGKAEALGVKLGIGKTYKKKAPKKGAVTVPKKKQEDLF
jgi:hypothetical protein